MTNNTDYYAWNDEIPDSPPKAMFVPAGVYAFRVFAKERRVWDKGKLAGSNYMRITLSVWDANGASADICANLTLHSKTLFSIRNFFKATGCKVEDGQPFRPDWDGLVGMTGRVELGESSYKGKDGQEYKCNEVLKWVPPDNSPLPPEPGMDANGDIPF